MWTIVKEHAQEGIGAGTRGRVELFVVRETQKTFVSLGKSDVFYMRKSI